ncbi:TPA: fimbrial protein [Klebsiella aerogenes]|uniref:fimbrial protein n=1 Tax=Klebsiella aerogenes TaxID=548 RepID=UPI0027E6C8FF|nr:fimbrial protein [Klebsiella aerogenes]MEB5695104.1 fimbrial protein [Klebsiella aerogenes]HDT6507888.1 fimbrial protein [Klebsiella aerogenes]
MRTTSLIYVLFTALFILPPLSYADTGMCYRSSAGDANAWSYDFGNISMSTTDNTAGVIKNDIAQFNMKGDAKLWCDCTTGSTMYFTSSMNLPPEGDNWFKLNQYLDAKLDISFSGNYKSIPYADVSSGISNSYCHKQTTIGGTPTGGVGRLSLKINRPFVGQVYIPHMVIAQECVTSGVTGVVCTQGNAAYTYSFSGSITVPQSCQINTGSQIVVDLNDISRRKFKYEGQKPEAFTPKTFNVPIQCNDSAAVANLSLRIQGNPTAKYPEALQSDNSDIGVVITDSTGTALKPNIFDSNTPFVLDGSNHANVVLQAYPIKTSGNEPGLGVFTTLAYIRVDFS